MESSILIFLLVLFCYTHHPTGPKQHNTAHSSTAKKKNHWRVLKSIVIRAPISLILYNFIIFILLSRCLLVEEEKKKDNIKKKRRRRGDNSSSSSSVGRVI